MQYLGYIERCRHQVGKLALSTLLAGAVPLRHVIDTPLSWRQLTEINIQLCKELIKVLSMKGSSLASLFTVEVHDECVRVDWPK